MFWTILVILLVLWLLGLLTGYTIGGFVSGPTYSATKNIVASRYPRAKPVALFKIQALLDALRSSPHSPTAKAEELCPLGYEIYEPAEEGDQFL
jgi:hypothetical protein